MNRIQTQPRQNWQQKLEAIGFTFHTLNGPYWDESAYYSFTPKEVDTLETATAQLWEMCLEAVQHVIDKKRYPQFHIPPKFTQYIEQGWDNDAPSIYGRFDFSFDPKIGVPKLLEFNADTPTALFEASVVQWHWLQDFDKSKDQFNSIHEKLIASWAELKPNLQKGPTHFSCVSENIEEFTTVEYLRDCAIQAGLTTQFVPLEEIGWDNQNQIFLDQQDQPITNCFKLYPWEWLVNETFAPGILADRNQTHWIEPSWKMILSNKAILPILYELFPNSPYILPAYFDNTNLKNYVKKPFLSREGANITLVKNNHYITHTEGEYGEEGFIYQQLAELPNFNNNFPVIGSWIIGQEPAGIGVRESNTSITDNLSRFVPHYMSSNP